MIQITTELADLRQAFVREGFDLRFVGGMVRDIMLGVDFHDVDLCSDANPDEQIAIYKANGFAYYETGIKHGTVTVHINNNNYEITSLRTETDHDGRHATVQFSSEQSLNPDLLQKFIDMGYNPDQEYDFQELMAVFQRINR
jgi:tRNA nucleotidyltransferase/poly(A) polymerase